MSSPTSSACAKHKMVNCPTSEWKPGTTVLRLLPEGALVHARVYDTPEAAAEVVTQENRLWERSAAKYDAAGLPKPAAFTHEGRIAYTVWAGGDIPTVDAWGRAVK